ncbi:MAG: hypothetical protein KGJ06_02850, partial [Pseudomonadota bacterium]|nr:hypothetical protein [Pseudomonadota bacterium]
MRLRLIHILLLLAAAGLGAPCAAADAPASADSHALTLVERPDDDLVLVDLRLGKTTLAESITGYTNKTSLMLPLGQLANALQFAIKVSPREGQAEGWFLSIDNGFTLDVARREAVVSGKRTSIAPGLVEAHADDIYVDTTLLSQWFPLDFNFSFSTQAVTIAPHAGVQLPVQQQAEREKQRDALGHTGQNIPDGPFPRVEVPYQLYTIPFTDLSYTSGYDQQTHTGLHNDFNVLSNGDLFYMHSSLYMDRANESSQLRWTLSRRDPDGKILQSDEWLSRTAL